MNDLTRADQYRTKRQRIIAALEANPDEHYVAMAARLGVTKTYVSQIKCDLRHRNGLPRSKRNYERPVMLLEHCETRVTPWFVDMQGFPTRIAVGVAVPGPNSSGRPSELGVS